jgi:polar amino acid transport system substrate-binding protein
MLSTQRSPLAPVLTHHCARKKGGISAKVSLRKGDLGGSCLLLLAKRLLKHPLRHSIYLLNLPKLFGASCCIVGKTFFLNACQRVAKTGYLVTGITIALVIAIPSSASAKTLRVGVAGSPPFVIRKGENISGLSVDVWQEIARVQKIDYEFIPQASVQDGLDAVNRNKLDLLVGALSITSKRLEKVDFTQPYLLSEVTVLTIAQDPSVWSRVKPFFESTALASIGILFGMVFLVGNIVWLVEHKNNSEHFPKDYLHGVGNGMWFALVTLTTVGYGDRTPVTYLGRFISGTWMITALVAVSSLTAGLASAMTLAFSGASSERFPNPASLKNARIATVTKTAVVEVAQKYETQVREVPTLADAVKEVVSGRVEAAIYFRPNLQYYLTQNSELPLKLSSFSLKTEFCGFALPPNSPLRQTLNLELSRMSENGVLKNISDRWLHATGNAVQQ